MAQHSHLNCACNANLNGYLAIDDIFYLNPQFPALRGLIARNFTKNGIGHILFFLLEGGRRNQNSLVVAILCFSENYPIQSFTAISSQMEYFSEKT